MGLEKYTIKTTTYENIEAEEIFLDAEAVRFIDDKGKVEQPIKNRNFIIFYGFIVVALLVLLIRAGYLQIVRGEYYYSLAEGNRTRVYSSPAPRGIIYDKEEQPLVYNLPNFDLVVDLADFLSNSASDQDKIFKEVAVVMANSEEAPSQSLFSEKLELSSRENEKINRFQDEFRQKINRIRGEAVQVALSEGLEYSKSLILESMISDWPGLRLEKNIRRQYISGPVLAHVIGFTGEKQSNSSVGKAGLELQYEEILRGEAGLEQVEVNALGQIKSFLATKPPQPGNGIVLFIDQALQDKIYQSLGEMLEKIKLTKAAAVAINPKNGAVLALVSLPSFDNNLFARGISQIDYNFLAEDFDQPFFNRVVAGQYPPGSTIKPMIAAAALEEKIVNSMTTIDDAGEISIVNQYNPQVVYRFRDWKVHGLTDIIKAIAESCNVYFYAVGGGYGQIEGLGIGRIEKYVNLFGLGKLTEIDLPYEESGLIPNKNWKKQTQEEQWFIGDTYHASIGQGDITATPLQIALAVAAIANNGVLYQPQLVDRIIDSDKKDIRDIQPKVIRKNFISPDNLAVVRKGMRQAVVGGSARELNDLSVEVAGKTGTAQFGNQAKTHAWFTGFAPYDDPEIVLAVLVEGGGEGHTAAVPVARDVFSWYFNQK